VVEDAMLLIVNVHSPLLLTVSGSSLTECTQQ
jgi:hypothetical protein